MGNPKNFNDDTPAAPSTFANVLFQAEDPDPDPNVKRAVSAYMPIIEGTGITLDIVEIGYKKYLQITAVPGGGIAFTDLSDVPASYSGQSGKLVRVNATEDGLEFTSSGGGGGGGMLEADFDVVEASDLTQDNFGAGTHLDDITIGSFTGVRLHEFGPGSDTNRMRVAGQTVPTSTSKWRLSCRVRRHTPLTAFEGLGLAVKDSGGKYIFFGWTYVNVVLSKVKFSNGSSYDGDTQIDTSNFFRDSGASTSYVNVERDLWMRIDDDNTNLTFWLSIDGDYWVKIFSEARTTYLNGTMSLAGIAMNPNNAANAAIETVIDCFSFTIENY
jgi:hypothetical protein